MSEEQVTSTEQLEQKEAERTTKTDIANTGLFFEAYLPRFSMMIDKLSSRQLRRLLNGIMAYALPTKQYQHKDETEKECFTIGLNLQYQKYRLHFMEELTKFEPKFMENLAILFLEHQLKHSPQAIPELIKLAEQKLKETKNEPAETSNQEEVRESVPDPVQG